MSVESPHLTSANGVAAEGDTRRGLTALRPAAGLQLARRRPEVLVGAAFAGGLIAAALLRRLGR